MCGGVGSPDNFTELKCWDCQWQYNIYFVLLTLITQAGKTVDNNARCNKLMTFMTCLRLITVQHFISWLNGHSNGKNVINRPKPEKALLDT